MDDRLKATIASIDEDRAGKAFGGSLSSDDPNKFFSDVLKYSFAVLPLLRPGYLKEVPKQGFAEGGGVDDALHVARQAAKQGGGLWDLLKRSAGEMAEMVEPGSTTRETPSVREVMEGMLPRDPYEVVGEAQKKFREGDKIGAFEEMLGGIPQTGAIRAYHGSPHSFDRFDLSKIGTGEGAQAYGHGLYFAENEGVAKGYRNALGGMGWLKDGAKTPFSRGTLREMGYSDNAIKHFMNAMDKSSGNTADAFSNLLGNRRYQRYGSTQYNDYDQASNIVENLMGGETFPKKVPAGHMYETLLHVDPEHLLDWDRPLRSQESKVQSIIEPLANTPFTGSAKDIMMRQGNISELVNLRDPKITQELSRQGIPGIKYLDQGSRATSGGELLDVFQGPNGWQSRIKVSGRGGAGFLTPTDSITTSRPFASEADARAWADSKINSGSRNYVMFSHDPVEIVRRYNQGGHVLEDDYPSQYMPGVGRQVMADGGGLEGARFAAMDPSMLVGTSQQPYRGGQSYTDAGGQKVAAPFVTGVEGGYPVFDLGEKPKPDVPSLPGGKNPFEDWLQFSFLSRLMGRAEGGRVDDAAIINTALDVLSDYSK